MGQAAPSETIGQEAASVLGKLGAIQRLRYPEEHPGEELEEARRFLEEALGGEHKLSVIAPADVETERERSLREAEEYWRVTCTCEQAFPTSAEERGAIAVADQHLIDLITAGTPDHLTETRELADGWLWVCTCGEAALHVAPTQDDAEDQARMHREEASRPEIPKVIRGDVPVFVFRQPSGHEVRTSRVKVTASGSIELDFEKDFDLAELLGFDYPDLADAVKATVYFSIAKNGPGKDKEGIHADLGVKLARFEDWQVLRALAPPEQISLLDPPADEDEDDEERKHRVHVDPIGEADEQLWMATCEGCGFQETGSEIEVRGRAVDHVEEVIEQGDLAELTVEGSLGSGVAIEVDNDADGIPDDDAGPED